MSKAHSVLAGDGRRRIRWEGVAIGLVYSLVYGLAVWGPDTWVLARSHAELAWVKLLFGLPLVLVIGATAGGLAARSGRPGAWVGAWMAGGILASFVVGQMPFAGYNVATWIGEPRLWPLDIYPAGPSGAARMVLATLVTGCAGSAAGLLVYLGVERAEGAPTQGDEPDGRSWVALALSLLLALGTGLLGDEVVNARLRAGHQAVHRAISRGPEGGDTALFRGRSSADRTLHLIDYHLESAQVTVDVAFEDGSVVRCRTLGHRLADCRPVVPEFEAWMDALIQEARTGGQGAAIVAYRGQLSVNAGRLSWLASQGEWMGENYEIVREMQRGGWVTTSARFDDGYVLTCDFCGEAPVILQGCQGRPPSQEQ